MKTEATTLDFSGQDIYVGPDVHLSSWTVSIYSAHLEHKTFRQDPDPANLLRYLKRHFPDARYHGVYEAGYSGFWIHDVLTAAGMDMMDINPADVPTTDCERNFKHDPVDARNLARGSTLMSSVHPIRIATAGIHRPNRFLSAFHRSITS